MRSRVQPHSALQFVLYHIVSIVYVVVYLLFGKLVSALLHR
jgi:hypothetical protein